MNDTTTPRPRQPRRTCASCKRRTARYRIRNAYVSAANGKYVCGSAVCWGHLTQGYPAEGGPIR